MDNESVAEVNKDQSEHGSVNKHPKNGETAVDGDSLQAIPRVAKTTLKLSRQNSQKQIQESCDNLGKKKYYMKQGLFKDKSEYTKRQSISRGEKFSQHSQSYHSKHINPTSMSAVGRMICRLPGKESSKQANNAQVVNSLANSSLYRYRLLTQRHANHQPARLQHPRKDHHRQLAVLQVEKPGEKVLP